MGVVAITLTSLRSDDAKPASPTLPASVHALMLAPASALEAPAILPHAVLWHPAGQPTLTFQPLDGRPPVTYNWIIGIPRSWVLISAGRNVYHLIWLNDRGELWRSQINLAGEQVLGAVAVESPAPVLDFKAIALSGGQAVLLWRTQQNFQTPVSLLFVNETGRPLLRHDRLIPDASHVALAANRLGEIHLNWINSGVGGRLDLHHAILTTEASQPVLVGETIIHSIDSPNTSWIESLALFSQNEALISLWGITTIQSPEQTQFEGIVWSNQTISTTFTVSIPGFPDAALRWLGQLQTQNPSPATLVLPFTAHINGAWQPVLLQLSNNGTMQDAQIIDAFSANASPPTVYIDPENYVTAAWVYLDEAGNAAVRVITDNPALLPD